MPPDDFAQLWASRTPAQRRDLTKARFRFDVPGFARWVWPERFEFPFNACHRSIFGGDKLGWWERPTTYNAIAAPRGLGKSTVASFADIAHDICYGLERFVVIMSATSSLATELVDDLRQLFVDAAHNDEHNIRQLFGGVSVKGGKTDFVVSVGGLPTCRVIARSFGQTIRGVKHQGVRPTKIVLDDAERSDRVISSDQRRKAWQFLTSDILKAGRKQGGTLFYVRGTVLHPDSLLANLLERPGWGGERWASIVSWPERMDLWEQCGRIWKDLSLKDIREAAALAFYEANREEMHRGAEVLDPVAEPLYALFVLIWAEGLPSFLREKQNQPRNAASAYYDSSKFARCRIEGDRLRTSRGNYVELKDLHIVIRLDPIPGKELGTMSEDGGSGAGDYAAIAVVGRDPDGYGYVLDVWMKRARDSEQVAAMWGKIDHWGPKRVKKVSIESNGFQRLIGRDFRRIQQQRREQGLHWQVAVSEDNTTRNKEDRIASLEPATTNRWLEFAETIGPDVMGQFDDFPSAAHDDAPDAIEGAYRLAGGSPVTLGQHPIM